jgi:Holliday junction resolvase RusA-like endonuclease
MQIRFTIIGECVSKANSRQLTPRKMRDEATGKLKTRVVSIKSDKALDYERAVLKQVPPAARVRLEGPVRIALRLWYASERPDLDESLLLDCLQDRWKTVKRKGGDERVLVHHGVYRNDRQIRQKHVYHAIDRTNPRADVLIEPIFAQQCKLDFFDPFEDTIPA